MSLHILGADPDFEYFETAMNALPLRLGHLMAIIVLMARGVSFAASKSDAAATNSTADQNRTNLLVGTWEENGMRIELRADRVYESWLPYLQSDLAAKTMLQKGKWNVRTQTLFLDVEKSFVGHVPPGTVVTYEIKSLSPERAVLASPVKKREVTWTNVSSKAEPFWKSALSYEPPFRMSSYLHPAEAGTVGDWELFSMAGEGTNGPAQVVFRLSTVAEFIAPEKSAKPLQTVADLKAFVDTQVKNNLRGGESLTSVFRIGGAEGLMSVAPTNRVPGGAMNWRGIACFFWEIKPVWQSNTICSITIGAEKRESFGLLTNSLKNVKLLGGKQKN